MIHNEQELDIGIEVVVLLISLFFFRFNIK